MHGTGAGRGQRAGRCTRAPSNQTVTSQPPAATTAPATHASKVDTGGSTGLPDRSTCPLSQPFEVADTRATIRDQVLDGAAYPQLILRAGWAPTSAGIHYVVTNASGTTNCLAHDLPRSDSRHQHTAPRSTTT